jgi:hypothetical protein
MELKTEAFEMVLATRLEMRCDCLTDPEADMFTLVNSPPANHADLSISVPGMEAY